VKRKRSSPVLRLPVFLGTTEENHSRSRGQVRRGNSFNWIGRHYATAKWVWVCTRSTAIRATVPLFYVGCAGNSVKSQRLTADSETVKLCTSTFIWNCLIHYFAYFIWSRIYRILEQNISTFRKYLSILI